MFPIILMKFFLYKGELFNFLSIILYAAFSYCFIGHFIIFSSFSRSIEQKSGRVKSQLWQLPDKLLHTSQLYITHVSFRWKKSGQSLK